MLLIRKSTKRFCCDGFQLVIIVLHGAPVIYCSLGQAIGFEATTTANTIVYVFVMIMMMQILHC